MFWFFDSFSYFLLLKVIVGTETSLNVTAGLASIVQVGFSEHKYFHLLVLIVILTVGCSS
jgi:hypothetical protein